MTTWVEDIVQALKNLGGQASLKDIYAEVHRIRKEALPTTWQASIRERLESQSSDSKNFKGNDIFAKVAKGTWALRNVGVVPASPVLVQDSSHAIPSVNIQTHEIPESFETVISTLSTIKQYRDYSDPSSQEWVNYIHNIFQIIGFHTEQCESRLILMGELGEMQSYKALLCYSLPAENFTELVPGLKWENFLLFAAKSYDIKWGVLTNGLQLKVIKFFPGLPHETSFWPNFDSIIQQQKADSFFPIYKLFSAIKNQ